MKYFWTLLEWSPTRNIQFVIWQYYCRLPITNLTINLSKQLDYRYFWNHTLSTAYFSTINGFHRCYEKLLHLYYKIFNLMERLIIVICKWVSRFIYDERQNDSIHKNYKWWVSSLFSTNGLVLYFFLFLNAGNKKRLFDKLLSIYKRCMVRALAI